MAENSNIEWTDSTVNFWWGCTKVGPGCDHCYAEGWSKRTGHAIWGAGAPRRKIKGAVKLMHKLDNDYSWWAADLVIGAGQPFRKRRVFVQSMSDLFDNEVPLEWFDEAWRTICACDRVEIQIVTKRLPMVEKRLAQIGYSGWPQHVGLIATIVNQDEADRDVPRLLTLKAKLGIPWVGLSIEPMLGPITLHNLPIGTGRWNALTGETLFPDGDYDPDNARLDWVIVGGESGPGARPMHPDWPRQIRDQCVAAGTAFFFKQWGEFRPPLTEADHGSVREGKAIGGSLMPNGTFGNPYGNAVVKVGKKAAGRHLDGRTWDQMPFSQNNIEKGTSHG